MAKALMAVKRIPEASFREKVKSLGSSSGSTMELNCEQMAKLILWEMGWSGISLEDAREIWG